MCPSGNGNFLRSYYLPTFVYEIHWQDARFPMLTIFVDSFISTSIDNAVNIINDIIDRRISECPDGYSPMFIYYEQC